MVGTPQYHWLNHDGIGSESETGADWLRAQSPKALHKFATARTLLTWTVPRWALFTWTVPRMWDTRKDSHRSRTRVGRWATAAHSHHATRGPLNRSSSSFFSSHHGWHDPHLVPHLQTKNENSMFLQCARIYTTWIYWDLCSLTASIDKIQAWIHVGYWIYMVGLRLRTFPKSSFVHKFIGKFLPFEFSATICLFEFHLLKTFDANSSSFQLARFKRIWHLNRVCVPPFYSNPTN